MDSYTTMTKKVAYLRLGDFVCNMADFSYACRDEEASVLEVGLMSQGEPVRLSFPDKPTLNAYYAFLCENLVGKPGQPQGGGQ